METKKSGRQPPSVTNLYIGFIYNFPLTFYIKSPHSGSSLERRGSKMSAL